MNYNMGLIGKILSFFRKNKINGLTLRLTEDEKSAYYVYDNQIESALNIIDNFKKGNRWCLLMAQMQSGKSGTFFSVPYIISRNENISDELGISYKNNEINMFLLTPMSDTELVSQFEQDIVSFTGVEIKRHVIHNNEMQKFLKTPKDEWTSTDVETVNKMNQNSIILIDESHYGSDKNQILNNFPENILNIKADGDNKPLEDKNMYVLSISATPMAERISVDDNTLKKTIIPLKNTKEYFGIVGMWDDGKIKQGFNLNNDDEIKEFVKHINNIDGDGYILVRANNRGNKSIEDIINFVPDNIECINYNQETKKSIFSNTDINDILSVKPNGKKIIFFKGKLRAGQRVKTENVIMVHDTHKSNSDTTAQSFLGRCCGYNKNREIEIFCDLKSAEGYYEWVRSGFSKLSTPKSKNVNKKQTKLTVEKISNAPIITIINDYDIANLIYKKSKSEDDKVKIMSFVNDKNINDILKSNFVIGTIFLVSDDNKNSTYEKHYIDKKNGTFLSDYHYDEEDINKYVISSSYNLSTNELVVLPGKVIKRIGKPELSKESMYSN